MGMFKKAGIYVGLPLLAVIGVAAIVGMLAPGFMQGSVQGDSEDQTPTEQEFDRSWTEFRQDIGMHFGTQQSSEQVVMIAPEVNDAGNYDSPDVTTIGADSDSDDEQELFKRSDVEEGEDYFTFSTFDSSVNSNLPSETGTYDVAVIGSGIANEYFEYTIENKDYSFQIENGNPLRPLQDTSVDLYAADGDITTDATIFYDGDSPLSTDSNFTDDKADADVDGTVTGVKEYSISGSDKVIQLGEVSISSVNSNVEEVTMTVMADGKQVQQVTDADPTDSDKLNDGVEFGAVTVDDEMKVQTAIEFEDSAISSSKNLVTSELDDVDDDSSSSDGSYGISALSETWAGY